MDAVSSICSLDVVAGEEVLVNLCVAVFAADAHRIALDGGLHLELGVLDDADNVLGLFYGTPCWRVIFCRTLLPIASSSLP
jgi:hypothetical protein